MVESGVMCLSFIKDILSLFFNFFSFLRFLSSAGKATEGHEEPYNGPAHQDNFCDLFLIDNQAMLVYLK